MRRLHPPHTSRTAALTFAVAWGALFAAGSATSVAAEAETSASQLVERAVVRVSGDASPQDLMQAIDRHGSRLLAVGSKGLLLESTDAALTWRRHRIPGRPPLIDVAVCEDGRFFLLDFRRGVWAQRDPEAPWTRTPIVLHPAHGATEPIATEAASEASPRSLALHCDGAGRLWAVGEQSSILRSDDGGQHWRSMSPDRSDRLLTAVAFLDPDRGRVVGEFGSYFVSEDGGDHWRRGPDIPGELYPHAAFFAVDGRSWAVGATGHVYRLDPEAEAWVQENSGTVAALYGVAPVGGRIVAVGAGGEQVWRPLTPGLTPRLDGAGGVASRFAPWNPVDSGTREGAARDWRGLTALENGGASFVLVGPAGLALVEHAPGAPLE